MANAVQCDECRAILEEFRGVLDELSPELAERFWSGRDTFIKMIGGTEEDAQRVEELGGAYRFRPWPTASKETHDPCYRTVHTVLRKMFVHRFRTGHKEMFNQLFKR